MFPRDPIANAQRIVSDLRSIFPPVRNVHVFGPLARLGWGTPPIITADLSIIRELPSIRIALLGRIDVDLPTKYVGVIELHMDVAGILTEPGVRVESCGQETSLWTNADVLSVTAPGEDDGRRLVLRRPFGSIDADLRYRIASDVPNHWFPFTMEIEDGQATFDLGSNEYVLRLSVLLDASTLGGDPAHLPTPQQHILNPDPTELRDVDLPDHPSVSRFSPLRVFESEAPRSGRRITRQYRLARWVDGDAHLWSSRAVSAGEAEAVSGLRFDFLEAKQASKRADDRLTHLMNPNRRSERFVGERQNPGSLVLDAPESATLT